jgi:hypothetical protein
MTDNKMNVHEVRALEKIVLTGSVAPGDDELPQTATEDELIVDLMHRVSGDPCDEIAATTHKQIIN